MLCHVHDFLGEAIARDPDRVLDAELLFSVQSIAEALALDERHDIEDHAARLARVV